MKEAQAVYVPPVRESTDHLPLLDVATFEGPRFMEVFVRAVSLKRQANTPTEAMFVAWLANRLPVSMIDSAGNLHVDLRVAPEHRTMFTAHTDTVHYGGGANPVRLDGQFWRADKGSALGADDAAGIAILYHMIVNNVPGYYVFFRGEECGGVGSSWLADEMPELFSDIDRGIAFDRAGYSDVITHQSGGRCCSNEFAQALANALSTETDWFIPDDTGVYTDTAEFTTLIPECTNISIGYKNQHGDREWQDVAFLQRMADIVLGVAWDELPVARDPRVRERRYSEGNEMRAYYDWLQDQSGEPKTRAKTSVEEDLVEALEEALYNDDFYALTKLIARTVYPEDYHIAVKELRAEHLTTQALEDALDALTYGIDAETLLQGLADKCVAAA